jgi:hypothetical protein
MGLVAALAITVPNPGTATSTSYAVNATATYQIQIRVAANEKINKGDRQVITFPANFDLTNMTLNSTGGGISSWSRSGNVLTIVSNAVPSNKTITYTIGGVVNPSQAGAYTITGSCTSSRATYALSWPLAQLIAAPSTAVTVLPVLLSSSDTSASASYSVQFTVGALGRLAGTTAVGANTVSITFPSDTTVPSSFSAGSVTFNGATVTNINVSGRTVTLSVPSTVTVPAGGTATVYFSAGAGLKNPTVVDNGYVVAVFTSAQTGTGVSPAYTIGNYVPTNIQLTSVNQPAAGYAALLENVAVDGFELVRTAGSQGGSVYSVTVSNPGDSPSLAVSGVSVYLDSGDLSFDATDTLLNSTPVPFTGGLATVAFDSPQVLSDNTPRQYWVVYRIAPSAVDGWVESSLVTTFSTDAENSSISALAGNAFTIDSAGPDVSWTYPAADSLTLAETSTVGLEGTAIDTRSGVASVGLQIRRASDGYWWSGSDWRSSATILTADGTSVWGYDWSLLPASQDGTETYTLYATGIDNVGNAGWTTLRTGIRIDNTGPRIVSAVAIDATHIDVSFSETLSVGVSGTFAIASSGPDTVNVTTATVVAGSRIVHLTTTAQTPGVHYTVTPSAGAVDDLVGNPCKTTASPSFLSGAIPTVQVSQGTGFGRPTGRVWVTHDATAVVDEISLLAAGGTANISTITVRGLDTAAALRTDIATVELRRDNGNGVFDTGDTLHSTVRSFSADASGTTLTFTNVNLSLPATAVPTPLWIVYRTGPTPVEGHEIGNRMLTGDVMSTNATTTSFSLTSANSGRTIAIDVTPPSTPASFHASAVSSASVEVTWTASTDALSGMDHYGIYRDGSLVGTVPAVATSYVATGAVPGVASTYTVTAFDVAGNESSQPTSVSVTSPGADLSMTIQTPGSGQSIDFGAVDPGNSSTTYNGTLIQVSGVGATKYTLTATALDFSNTATSSTTPTMPISALSYLVQVGGAATYGPVAFSKSPVTIYTGYPDSLYPWQQSFVFDYVLTPAYGYDPGHYVTSITYTCVQE